MNFALERRRAEPIAYISDRCTARMRPVRMSRACPTLSWRRAWSSARVSLIAVLSSSLCGVIVVCRPALQEPVADLPNGCRRGDLVLLDLPETEEKRCCNSALFSEQSQPLSTLGAKSPSGAGGWPVPRTPPRTQLRLIGTWGPKTGAKHSRGPAVRSARRRL